MGSYLDKLLLGLKGVERDGVRMPSQPIVNFRNFSLILDNPTNGSTDVYAPTVSGGGSTSPAILLVENAGTAMPYEPVLNFIGFSLVDNPGSTRTDITAGSGTPSAAASTLVMTASSPPWALIQAGEIVTFPVTMVTGITYEFTDVTGGLTSNPVTFQRPGGASYMICDPQNPIATPTTSVTGRVSGVTYRFRYDGSGVVRCVN